ncbi:MAG: alkaline phosphatase family protein, partial [Bacteroidales bacterium]
MKVLNISKKLQVLLATVVLCCSPGLQGLIKAQPLPAVTPPSLIVGLVVDGMRADWVDRYWHLLGEGGIKKLFTQGLSFSEATVPFLMADIGSSHASISTGATPALHGIISARWHNRISREEIHCTSDHTARPVGSLSVRGRHSPRYLLTPTINDMLLMASVDKSKVVTVSLQPESSVLLAGHRPSSCYWFNTADGTWISSNHYLNQLPQWVNQYNHRNVAGN